MEEDRKFGNRLGLIFGVITRVMNLQFFLLVSIVIACHDDEEIQLDPWNENVQPRRRPCFLLQPV
jgi:hypothetical protein